MYYIIIYMRNNLAKCKNRKLNIYTNIYTKDKSDRFDTYCQEYCLN